jgi:hypothetical protein
MPPRKADPDKAEEQSEVVRVDAPGKLSAARLRDARFIGGAWVDVDGRPFSPIETRQIHQARDAEALAAKQRALLGGG